MSINFDKALGVHPYALQVRSERAQILAGNLANVDTPGYQARDIDYAQILQNIGEKLENSASSSDLTVAANQQMQHPLYRIPYQPSADGNTAELGVEQTKFGNNAMDFQTSLAFLNMKITGLAKAIEGR